MLNYSFNNIGSDSLYNYLYKCIRDDILAGKLKSGEKLPSKRTFAKNLGISVITVENAYEQLSAEGYIYSIAKKGFYVADMKNLSGIKPVFGHTEDINTSTDPGKYIADFTSNKVNKDLFPFSVWSKLIREVLRDNQELILAAPSYKGTEELRSAISDYLRDFKGIKADPDHIIIGAGSENLYGQIVQLLGHDKIYGVEDPGYQKTSAVYEANGVRLARIPFDRAGINIEKLLSEGVNVAHISPSHQFPTGIVTPISKRYELLGWASKEEDRYIIEDDYDSEFRLTGHPIPSLFSIDTTGKVIYMNTFSKSLSPSLRVSFMVLPDKLMARYKENLSFYTCPVTSMIQLTLARFILEGYFEKHLNRMRNFYKRQRDTLIRLISESKMSELVSISEEDAGLHFLISFNELDCTDSEFKALLLKKGIKIYALSDFYYDKSNPTEHTFVLNYSSLTEDELTKAVAILDRITCKPK